MMRSSMRKASRRPSDVLQAIRERLRQCGLELHPEKTKIVYCQDTDRRGTHDHIKFDFLGYTFRPRRAKNRWGKPFVSFLPAVSTKAAKSVRANDSFLASWSDPQQPEPGGDRKVRQPLCARLGELLRSILSIGADPSASLPRTLVGVLGTSQIQTICLPSSTSGSLARQRCPPRTELVRAMANRNSPRDWTIRAG